MTLRAARLPGLTKKLPARLSRNWVSVLCIDGAGRAWLTISFAIGAAYENDLVEGDNQIAPLQRKCAQELVMVAAVAPFVFTNVAA